MSGESKPTEDRLFKAIAHPLRLRILEQLNQGDASPAELAKKLDEPLGNVSYHVQVLLKFNAIELVSTRPVRGAIEHIYRATAQTQVGQGDHWANLPASLRRSLFDPKLQKIWDDVVEAASGDGLDDERTHISWTTLELDDEGREQMADLLRETLERAQEIHSRVAPRLAKLPEDERATAATELAVMHYDRPPPNGSEAAAEKPRKRSAARKG
jgi:DNA-binding transcriptional ArsR family regulator